MEKKRLVEWALNFVKSKTAVFGEARKVEQKADKIVAILPDKKETFIIIPELSDTNFLKDVKDELFCVVCFNSKKNLDFLIKNWEKFLKFKKLCFCFANPDSTLEKKWIVYPYAHSLFTEKSSLRPGLLSLLSSVDLVN